MEMKEKRSLKGFVKRVVISGLAAVLAITLLTACGITASDGSSEGELSIQTGQPKAMERQEYIDKVIQLSDEISNITNEYSDDLNSTDAETVITATRNMIEEMKPIYGQLGDLSAPEEFSTQQEQIRKGCDASVEALDMSLELLDLSLSQNQGEENTQEVAEKITQLSSKMTELEDQASGLTSALSEIRLA